MKVAKNRAKPKKFPAQERSKLTVDAILEAATYILTNEAWENFNTNKVAEKAGVNIASLYQYFPNKESILSELYRRHFEDLKSKGREYEIADLSTLDLHDLLERIVRDHVSAHKDEPKLHKVLREKVPKSVWWVDSNHDRGMEDVFEKLIISKSTGLKNKKFVGFFLKTGLGAFIHEAVDQHPEYFADPDFVPELTRFFEAYLSRS